jgi:VanZ family protein
LPGVVCFLKFQAPGTTPAAGQKACPYNKSLAFMRQLLIVTVLIILYGSFYPWHFTYPPGPFLLPVSVSDQRDLLLNFWLYTPVGALAYWAFARGGILRWIVPFCLGLALSIFVELVQPFIPGRVSSLGDILANGLGTLAGTLLAAWAGAAPQLSRWQLRRSPEAFLLAVWVALLLFPLLPVRGPTALLINIRALQTSPFLWTDLAVWTIAWLVVWELLPGAFVRGGDWMVKGLLLLLLPARLFVILRVLTKAELAAGFLAVLLLLWRPRIDPRAPVAAILVALALRGLMPWEFSSSPAPFEWIPLAGLFNATWQPALLILIGKIFWYGSAVWALSRLGLGLGWCGGLLAVLLAGIEVTQRFMPAHVPEITDPLLALACAAAFHFAFHTQAPGGVEPLRSS